VCVCVCRFRCAYVRACSWKHMLVFKFVRAWRQAYVYLSLVCACSVHVQADAQVGVCQCAASTLKWWKFLKFCLCETACGACACAHGCTHARPFCACCLHIHTLNLLLLLAECSKAWAVPAAQAKIYRHLPARFMKAYISSLWGEPAGENQRCFKPPEVL